MTTSRLHHYRVIKIGAGVMSQRLRTQAALLEDPGWIYSTHMAGSSSPPPVPVPGDPKTSAGLFEHDIHVVH